MQIRDLPYADPGHPDVRSGVRFLLWLGRRQLGGQAKALAWGMLHIASVASLPLAAGQAVQAAVAHSQGRLKTAGALLLVLGASTALGNAMQHRAAITNWMTAAARTQQLLARKVAEMGAPLTRRVAAGEVVAVSTGDVEKIGWCVEAVSPFGAALTTSLGVCAGLIVYQWQLGLLVVLGLVLLALAWLPLLPLTRRRADVHREKAGRAAELAADTVAGLRVLRGIGGEELFLARYRRASQAVRRAAVHTERMWAVVETVQVGLPGLLLVGVVWHGTRLALAGRMDVGDLVTVYGAVTFLLVPLRLFQEFGMAYTFCRPSAARAVRVLALRRDPGRRRDEAAVPGTAGTREEETPNGDLFDPVTGLRAPEGELTGVVVGDPDAAGALADRLGGHPAGGEATESVRLGGVPLDALPLGSAREAVLVQDKDPVLLSGTVKELFDVPSTGSVSAREALEAAQCDDVLEALSRGGSEPGGDPLDARISERGRSLSGGQRQRLALARSLLTDPRVLVLDEPTSAVDSHTETRVAEALRRVRSGRTTVVFSSSPLLLDRADRVVLVQGGLATAAGTHRDLLRTAPGYRAVVTRGNQGSATGRRPGVEDGPAPLADA